MEKNKNFLERLFSKEEVEIQPSAEAVYKQQLQEYLKAEDAKANHFSRGTFRNVIAMSYDGEKNLGEAGPIVDYRLDYEMLRMRSWQALIESEIAQMVVKRTVMWVVGSGLKLTCEPANFILEQENIKLDKMAFSKTVEQRFNLYKNSQASDYTEMENLDAIANTAYTNAIVGGDVLVVLRYDGKNVTTQLIDGEHVKSPRGGTEYYPELLVNGNKIINGIEIAPNGKHVRYYVRNLDFTYTTIEAYGKRSGVQMAFLLKGLEHRLDNYRGMPLISAVVEKLKKLERYESATIGSAEERQKIVYAIEHTKNSTGESPLTKQIATASNYSKTGDIAEDSFGNSLANKIGVSTNKQVFNMGMDSQLKALESKNELYFKEFYTVNIELVCAAIGIPPQIATSKYEGNFSASRAALKDWENTLNVMRKKFANNFYQKVFNFWLEVQIADNKIKAPGYIEARLSGNSAVLEAYRKCRFVGSSVPHIDPLKEVNAIREMLGETGASLPLITMEEATERLTNGESHDNMVQYAQELNESKTLGIKVDLPPAPINTPLPKKSKPAN